MKKGTKIFLIILLGIILFGLGIAGGFLLKKPTEKCKEEPKQTEKKGTKEEDNEDQKTLEEKLLHPFLDDGQLDDTTYFMGKDYYDFKTLSSEEKLFSIFVKSIDDIDEETLVDGGLIMLSGVDMYQYELSESAQNLYGEDGHDFLNEKDKLPKKLQHNGYRLVYEEDLFGYAYLFMSMSWAGPTPAHYEYKVNKGNEIKEGNKKYLDIKVQYVYIENDWGEDEDGEPLDFYTIYTDESKKQVLIDKKDFGKDDYSQKRNAAIEDLYKENKTNYYTYRFEIVENEEYDYVKYIFVNAKLTKAQ